MTTFLRFHNEWLLWLVQELFYGYWPLSIALTFVLLICLPSHRWSALALTWTTVIWSVLCLGFYNAMGEAPALAWFLVGALTYRTIRWVCWRLPRGGMWGAPTQGPAWVRLRAAWVTPIVRDYLTVDPRGVYWFDLARAVRGLTVSRTSADRRQALFPPAEISIERQQFWKVVLRLVEWRIRLFERLPSYWHRPHAPLDLDEPHFRGVLADQSRLALQRMLRCWTGNDFSDYCSRDKATQRKEMMNAAYHGQKFCLHREALAEYLSLRTPWRKKDKALVQAASHCYETWRHRRQYDVLWAEMLTHRKERPNQSPAAISMAANVSSNGQPVGEGQPELINDGELHVDGELEPTESMKVPETALIDLSEGNEELEQTPDSAKSIDRDLDWEDDFSDDEMFNIEPASEETFATSTPDALDAFVAGTSGPQQHRLRDLTSACQMLEAVLGVEPVAEFAAAVAQVKRHLTNSSMRKPAVMLLMFYCLRRDFSGGDVDQRKIDLMIELDDWFGNASDDVQTRETMRLYHTMRVDLHMERNEFAQVREFFSRRDDLSQYEHKILADAEALTASHLTGQSELRDMLRYEAICNYFEAGFCGLWTLEYAHLLVDKIESTEDLLALLRDHPTNITAPRTLPLGEKKLREQATMAAGGSILKLVLYFQSVRRPQKAIPHTVTKLPFTIGSDKKQTDACLQLAGIEAIHVRVFQHRDGLLVTDVSQSTGIRVNGGPSVPHAILRQGDSFQFGDVVVQIASLVREAA